MCIVGEAGVEATAQAVDTSAGIEEGKVPRRCVTGMPGDIAARIDPVLLEGNQEEEGGENALAGTEEGAEARLTTSEGIDTGVAPTAPATMGTGAMFRALLIVDATDVKEGELHLDALQQGSTNTLRARPSMTVPLRNAPAGMGCKFQRVSCR